MSLVDCVYYEQGSYENYEIHFGDLLIAMSGATTGKTAIYRDQAKAYLNQRVGRFKPIAEIHYPLLYSIVNSPAFRNQLNSKLIAGAQPNISSSDIESIKCYIPHIDEQIKIATLMQEIDKRIAIQNKIIEDLKKLKTAIRDVIFTAVRNVNDKTEFVSDLLSYEQPTNYIVESTEYSDNASLTPVLTANKGFILGYTPETFGIYRKGECIIFDDFTMDSKFVDFPFKVKSSAMKILTVKADVDLRFMFEYLQSFDLHSEEHKRHYISEVETMEVSVPEYERQQQIGKILACIQGKIDNEISIKMALLRQKNCLLSTMFI